MKDRPSPVRKAISVAYFTHYADLYGANRSLLDLMLCLRATGEVDPHLIIATEGAMVQRTREAEIPVEVLPFDIWMSKRVYMGGPHHRLMQWWGHHRQARERQRHTMSLLPRLGKLLKEWEVDLLHSNSSVIGIGHAAAHRFKLPLVWHIREFAFKHYHLHPDAGHRGFRKALRQADRVIAISEAIRNEFAPLLPPEKAPIRIYNGIISDEEMERLAQALKVRKRPGSPFTFALVGYFHKSKGQIEAIRAFSKLRKGGVEARLLLAGSGRDNELRGLLAELDLGTEVELLGFVDRPEEIYERADALVVCSRYEALGRVTIEAMAHGLPVIGYASGGTPELISHGHTGHLYNDEPELVRYMEELASDPAIARAMGEAAFRSLGRRFSLEERSHDVLQVYRQVMAERCSN